MPRLRHDFTWNSSEAAVQALANAGNDDGFEMASDAVQDIDVKNKDILKECLTELIVQKLAERETRSAPRGKKATGGRRDGQIQASGESSDNVSDAESLSNFIHYMAEELFETLTQDSRQLSHDALSADSKLAERYSDPLPDSTLDVLIAPVPAKLHEELVLCGALPEGSRHPERDFRDFMSDLYSTYVERCSAALAEDVPDDISIPAGACELCERDWVPLTVHHLIPRSTWTKAVTRGWIVSEEEGHQRLAWLCRACHSCVHRCASNLELARRFNSIESLLEREDVRNFAKWAAKIRWKKT